MLNIDYTLIYYVCENSFNLSHYQELNNTPIRPCQIGILLRVNSSLINLRYLFTKTHKPKTKKQMFYDKNNALCIYSMGKTSSYMKQWSELLTLTTFSMT